jgi:DNA-binding SARP family transcriptional activator
MAEGAAPMFYAGRVETLINWYEEIPGSLRPGFPILLLFVARAMIVLGRTGEAMPLLHQAEALFKQQSDAERALFAAVERANVCYTWGHYADTLAQAQEVLEQATDYPEPSALAHQLAGLAYLELGQPQEAVEHLRAALALCQKLGLLQETTTSYMNLSLALNRQGKLGESLDCLEQAIKLSRQAGPSHHLAMALNNVAYERYYLAGDYVQARDHLREALDVARLTGSSREQVFAMLSMADLYRDLGAVQEARELYAQARDLARRAGHTALVNYALLGDSLAVLRGDGDVIEAIGRASQARDQARGREDVYQLGLSYLALGLAHLETGELSTALQEIERGRDWLEQSDARRDLTRACVLQARALQLCGNQEGALEVLRQALDLGIETQTFHHLVVEGQRVFDLFRRLDRRNQGDRRTTRIMDRIRALPNAARDAIGGIAPTALPYTPKLRLYGFGPGRAEIDGHEVPTSAWQSRTPRHLIFYLLLHAPCSLEHILKVFWPGVDKSSARPTFHVVKQRVNRALGRRMITYVDNKYHLAWDPDCWFDVGAFESLLNGKDGRLERLKAATALYQGEFLNDYDAEWASAIRIHLRMRYRNALVELGELYMEQDEFAEGFSVLCRATPVDNLYEPASRALMRLYASDGRRDSALRHYERLRDYLRQDVGTVPDDQTQSLYEAIQTGASAAQLTELAQTFPAISA